MVAHDKRFVLGRHFIPWGGITPTRNQLEEMVDDVQRANATSAGHLFTRGLGNIEVVYHKGETPEFDEIHICQILSYTNREIASIQEGWANGRRPLTKKRQIQSQMRRIIER